ncbi:antitermination protein [Xenorhabdus bovienii]|uniref:antitermination protein n=1 Tax=Xenorhabdus bovienii TaxID=40576 RepID=UPI001EDF72A1|nr:antitermination protein [Xenorhabdus bovienii]MCG3463434.1 antitermination protein [Xenorhabdus bovienii]
MNLESLPKYFSPKTALFSDSPAATATDSFSITDVMASLGLASAQARMGIELFLAKHGINKPDEAVESLYHYALTQVHKHPAISKLDEDVKGNVLQILANYAFQDYARSAASKKPCSDCEDGFIEAEVFTTKWSKPAFLDIPDWAKEARAITPDEWYRRRQVREVVRVACKACSGKGEVSHSCRCNGRGEVLDKKQTKLIGIPVFKTCPKCSGRGYSRLPAEDVRRAICDEVMEMPETTWRRNFKPFYEALIEECFKEESRADSVLSKLTKIEFISI